MSRCFETDITKTDAEALINILLHNYLSNWNDILLSDCDKSGTNTRRTEIDIRKQGDRRRTDTYYILIIYSVDFLPYNHERK